ncbi:hypothetical protein MAR_023753, partial [Mya arenaria]
VPVDDGGVCAGWRADCGRHRVSRPAHSEEEEEEKGAGGEQGDLFQMYEGMRKPPDYNQLFSQRPTSASRAHDHTNETETKLPPDDLSVDLNDAREMQSVPPPSFHASRGYPERAPTTVIVAQSPVREG